jgi:carboxyl-terminal processing protease
LLLLASAGVALLLLVGFAGGVVADRRGWVPGRVDQQPARLGKTFAPFWEAWDKVDKHFVDREKADDDVAKTQGAIRGMLSSLGDQGHTTYLTAEQLKEQVQRLSGEVEGIGATVTMTANEPSIVRTLPGSPARKAGLQAKDVLVEVDGKSVKKQSLQEVISLVRGKPGTEVKLRVRRAARKELLDFSVERARVEVPEVAWQLLPEAKPKKPFIAHFALPHFSKTSGEQLRSAIKDARAKGAKGIILDLRGNGGGYKDQALLVASEFIPEGKVVFIQKDARGRQKKLLASAGGEATDLPVCVLVDRSSASSSEIVAGAIQDHKRGKVVGQRTFGTGTILRKYDLSDGGAIWLAIALWLTPNGRQIWHQGISPDDGLTVALSRPVDMLLPDPDEPLTLDAFQKSTDAQLRKAYEVLGQEIAAK